MKKTLLAVFAAMLVLGTNTAAWANGGPYTSTLPVFSGIQTPTMSGTPSNGIPDIYNAINLLLGTTYTSNADANPLLYSGSTALWQNVGDASTGGAAFIGISAGNTNTLRVYDALTPATKLDVFPFGFTGTGLAGDGSLANPFVASGVPLAAGTKFGWNLKSSGLYGNSAWDSDTSFNPDGMDHLFVYHLSALAGKTVYLQNPTTLAIEKYTYQDPYFLAWEDLTLASNGAFSDQDYNDIMYVVDRVVPVPEPSTVALFAFGLVGLGAFTLRRKLMMA